MALLHDATLTPTKRELLDAWLPSRSWYDDELDRRPVGSFRLDDPAGEVGLEGFLLGSAAGSTLFVPLTYRGAPLAGAEQHLVGTTEHSVLGPRWVYDACGDPVWVATVAATILTGGRQADLVKEVDGQVQTLEPSATVLGSGESTVSPPAVTEVSCRDDGAVTVVDAGELELVVARVVGTPIEAAQTLAASWEGGRDVVIAGVRPR